MPFYGVFGWLGRMFGGAKQQEESGEGSRFRFFGRRAHVVGVPYVLAKDQGEMNRLDLQHYMLRQAMRGLYAAPLTQPHAILDVGTGTGRWAMEMARLFPSADVTGVDITTPAESEKDDIPPNYHFKLCNLLEGLPFADASFDFVHQRLLVVGIPTDQWPQVITELKRVTRPGGWVELMEGDLQQGDPAFDALQEGVVNLSLQRGIDIRAVRSIGQHLQNAGFANVFYRQIRLPFGAKGGRVGKLLETDYMAGMTNLTDILDAKGIIPADEYSRRLAAARRAAARGNVYWPVYIAYGQRVD